MKCYGQEVILLLNELTEIPDALQLLRKGQVVHDEELLSLTPKRCFGRNDKEEGRMFLRWEFYRGGAKARRKWFSFFTTAGTALGTAGTVSRSCSGMHCVHYAIPYVPAGSVVKKAIACLA